MECHDSSVFLIRKLPLSITEALLKSMEWSWDHAWFAILEPLAAVFTFLMCSFTSQLPLLNCIKFKNCVQTVVHAFLGTIRTPESS